MQNPSLRILMVEDSEDDAGLILEEIRKAGYVVESERVETTSAMHEALADRSWDVVICDYTLPHFSATEAIRALNESRVDIPLIIVSGTVGEESAVAVLEAGASDFLVKGRLARLALAISRAIESKRLDRQLRATEQRLVDILEHASEAIIAVDEQHQILIFNKAAEEMFGYTAREIVGQPVDLLIPERLAAIHRDRVRYFAASADTSRRIRHRGELVARRKDGSEFPAEIGLSKLLTGEGMIVTAMIVDITQRRRAEEAAQQMQDRFKALTEHAPDGIALAEENGQLRFMNPSGWNMIGYDPEEAPEFNPAALIHPDDLPVLTSVYSYLIDKPERIPTVQFRFRKRNGEWLWIEGIFTNLRSVKGIQAIVINFRDVTEARRAERKIREQIERLTALRELDQVIASTLDLRVGMEMLLSRAMQLLGADAAALLLLDPVGNTLQYRAGMGFRTNAIQETRVPIGQSFAGKVAMERKMIHVENTLDESKTEVLTQLLRAEAFVSYFGAPLIAKGKLLGVLELFSRTPAERDQDALEFFGALAGQAAIMVDGAQLFNKLQVSNAELSIAYDATIEGWSRALDLRDRETEGHTQRVTEMTMRLARELGFPDDEIVHIRRGALLHDIGKLGVPDQVLLKPEPLSDSEWEIMKQHPTFAYELLRPIMYLRSAALDIPYCHHEKWDGTGYPRGLKGNDIPLAARVFSVVDVWDALTSDRPYRPAWEKSRALKYIQENSGKQFDPKVVSSFLELLR